VKFDFVRYGLAQNNSAGVRNTHTARINGDVETAAIDEGKETPRKCRRENAWVKMNLRLGPPTISA
jgi:hypothetical protein